MQVQFENAEFIITGVVTLSFSLSVNKHIYKYMIWAYMILY